MIIRPRYTVPLPLDYVDGVTLRVAFDATPLLGIPTGVGAVTAALLRGLNERDDIDVAAFAQSLRGHRGLAAVLPDGMNHNKAPMPAGLMQRLWAHSNKPSVERWTGRVDVVHGTNFVVPPSHGAEVVTVHDLTAVRFPEMCTSATLRYPRLIRAAVKRGAHVHTYSQYVAKETHELLGVAPENIHVIPPVVELAEPSREPTPFVTGRYILALGTIEPRKDYLTLIRAFDRIASKHPEVTLVIAGSRGWGFEQMSAAISAAEHKAQIRYVGRVTNDERAALLSNARVLAYSSVYEGYGLPPLEAMAAGIPVVATSVGAVPEVVGDAALLVVPTDVDALAEGLLSGLEDDYLRAGLIDRGHTRVKSLDSAKSVEQFAQLYKVLA